MSATNSALSKHPFGAAQYLGATLPLDGYGIRHLSLSESGTTLLGQLNGEVNSNPYTFGPGPNQVHAWDVNALISAALAMPDADRMSKHIVLPPLAEQLVANNTGPVAGTAFDPDPTQLVVEGNFGDIIGVNIKELIAQSFTDPNSVVVSSIDISKYTKDTLGKDRADGSSPPLQLILDKKGNIYSRSTVDSLQSAPF